METEVRDETRLVIGPEKAEEAEKSDSILRRRATRSVDLGSRT